MDDHVVGPPAGLRAAWEETPPLLFYEKTQGGQHPPQNDEDMSDGPDSDADESKAQSPEAKRQRKNINRLPHDDPVVVRRN